MFDMKKDVESATLVDRVVMRRPGRGWKHIAGPIWDHVSSGLRLHVSGMCRLPCGEIVYGRMWPQSSNLDRWIAIAGGNVRRGCMMWALDVLRRRG